MRRLLILMSLKHTGEEKKKISYHKFTVRLAESMINKSGQNLFDLTTWTKLYKDLHDYQ
jgi:hypothetical protein